LAASSPAAATAPTTLPHDSGTGPPPSLPGVEATVAGRLLPALLPSAPLALPPPPADVGLRGEPRQGAAEAGYGREAAGVGVGGGGGASARDDKGQVCLRVKVCVCVWGWGGGGWGGWVGWCGCSTHPTATGGASFPASPPGLDARDTDRRCSMAEKSGGWLAGLPVTHGWLRTCASVKRSSASVRPGLGLGLGVGGGSWEGMTYTQGHTQHHSTQGEG
jgi:hypothetical protein